jgi:hypothetical protein
VESHNFAGPVHKNKEIAIRNVGDVARGVLNRHWVRARHDGARNWKVSEQRDIVDQHGFAFMPKILEGGDGVSQILANAETNMVFHAAAHQQKAGRSKASGDQ